MSIISSPCASTASTAASSLFCGTAFSCIRAYNSCNGLSAFISIHELRMWCIQPSNASMSFLSAALRISSISFPVSLASLSSVRRLSPKASSGERVIRPLLSFGRHLSATANISSMENGLASRAANPASVMSFSSTYPAAVVTTTGMVRELPMSEVCSSSSIP